MKRSIVIVLFLMLLVGCASTPAPVAVNPTMSVEDAFATIAADLEGPTVTPVPTAAPISEAARFYIVDASTPIDDYREWFDRLVEQTMKVNEDPQVLADDTWKVQTATAVTALRDAAERLDALDPGDSEATELDRILRQIAHETGPMTEEYLKGTDDIDPDMMKSAVDRIKKIQVWMADVKDELATLQQ